MSFMMNKNEDKKNSFERLKQILLKRHAHGKNLCWSHISIPFYTQTVKEQALDCQAWSGNIWTETFRNSPVDNDIL